VLATDVCYCAPCIIAYVEEDEEKALEDAKNCWRKLETSLSLVWQHTNKVSATTIADGYADGPSSLETLCFASSRQAQRSSSRHGKDLIS
jgi:hypothetical protein